MSQARDMSDDIVVEIAHKTGYEAVYKVAYEAAKAIGGKRYKAFKVMRKAHLAALTAYHEMLKTDDAVAIQQAYEKLEQARVAGRNAQAALNGADAELRALVMEEEMEKEAVDEYMKRLYPVTVALDDKGDWVLELLDLPGCFAGGKSEQGALEMLLDAKRGWIADGVERGERIPLPSAYEKGALVV